MWLSRAITLCVSVSHFPTLLVTVGWVRGNSSLAGSKYPAMCAGQGLPANGPWRMWGGEEEEEEDDTPSGFSLFLLLCSFFLQETSRSNICLKAATAVAYCSLSDLLRSPWLSRSVIQWKKENKDIGGGFVEDPQSWCWLSIRWLRQMKRFFESQSLWLCLSSVPRKGLGNQYPQSEQRAFLCQSHS